MRRDALEERLVEGCKVLADDGQGDLIWGHVSARVPGLDETILMKPAGFGLDEIERPNLITVNLDGEKTAGLDPLHVEVFIHTEILRARSDVQAVVHTHPIHAVAFSALDRPLIAISHEGAMFCEGLPVFDQTSDLIVNPRLGQDVANRLGDANAVLLRNHGIVTVGRSVEEAVMTAIMLEKACRTQLLAEAAGEIKASTGLEEARAKRQRIYGPRSLESAFRYCVRRQHARTCGCRGNGVSAVILEEKGVIEA
ncbi:aldolase [Skermanella stibiiresistens SB22]|uniref:Aldolase n=1 Tax=Skermanella stibiiresistens SB22 TaxID=1385369 RepID=W9HAI0_9PROT|nr:class II aldolase/adducin family protein [Skermanella stibiiresistens]EWY41692.1 aldolase [Skermanella stibiiresistens SB22]